MKDDLREIDKQIHEKVFDEKRPLCIENWYSSEGMIECPRCGYINQLHELPKTKLIECNITVPKELEPTKIHVPFYSIRIEDAWMIVKKIHSEIGYRSNIGKFDVCYKAEDRYLTSEGYPLGTTCYYVRLETNNLLLNICAETAQLAICKAALKTVEVK